MIYDEDRQILIEYRLTLAEQTIDEVGKLIKLFCQRSLSDLII